MFRPGGRLRPQVLDVAVRSQVPHETQEIVDYCAAHNIKANVELIRPKDINRAYERVVNKDVRYRIVIDMVSKATGREPPHVPNQVIKGQAL